MRMEALRLPEVLPLVNLAVAYHSSQARQFLDVPPRAISIGRAGSIG